MAYDGTPQQPAGQLREDFGERTIPLAGTGDAYGGQPSETAAVDRMGIHIVIEALLLLGFAGVLFAFYRSDAAPLAAGDRLGAVIVFVVPLLLMAVAVSASLRVGAANLAAGGIAVVAAVAFVQYSERGIVLGVAAALGAALVIGLVVAVSVTVLRVPGWLAGAAITTAAMLWVSGHVDPEQLLTSPVKPLGSGGAWIWLVSVAALSVLAGIVGAMSGWRSRLGACRRAVAGTGPWGAATVATTWFALLASCLLAGAAGVWVVWTATPGPAVVRLNLDPLLLTGFGLAAALLGGTSVYGRRGGILGTLLATLGLGTLLMLSTVDEWRMRPLWLLLIAIAAGVIIMRFVEAFGSPAASEPELETGTDTGRHDSTLDNYDSGHRPGDIDPYRGVPRQDGY